MLGRDSRRSEPESGVVGFDRPEVAGWGLSRDNLDEHVLGVARFFKPWAVTARESVIEGQQGRVVCSRCFLADGGSRRRYKNCRDARSVGVPVCVRFAEAGQVVWHPNRGAAVYCGVRDGRAFGWTDGSGRRVCVDCLSHGGLGDHGGIGMRIGGGLGRIGFAHTKLKKRTHLPK